MILNKKLIIKLINRQVWHIKDGLYMTSLGNGGGGRPKYDG
jgi:hypothetical protein